MTKTENTKISLKRDVAKANREYQDAIAFGYEKDTRNKYGVLNKNCQARVRKYLSYLKNKHNFGVFLDLGCGTGNLLRVASDIFEKTIGVDISEKMLQLSGRYTNKLIASNAYSLPFKDSSLDVIGASAFLHHIVEHQDLFKEIRRVLKDGGVFFSDYEPNSYSLELLKNSRLLKPFWRFHNFLGSCILSFFSKKKINKDVESLADYYSDRGLNYDDLVACAKGAGFKDIRVITHLDSNDFDIPYKGRFMHKVYDFILKMIAPHKSIERRAKLFCIFLKKS